MYELTIESEFCAAHAITIKGQREPLHGHNWRVSVTIAGDTLDDDQLLCDFHDLEKKLAETLAPYHNANLNECSPFDAINPTAERVARHIAESLAEQLPKGLHLTRASVTEAPNCKATYLPPSPHSDGERAG